MKYNEIIRERSGEIKKLVIKITIFLLQLIQINLKSQIVYETEGKNIF